MKFADNAKRTHEKFLKEIRGIEFYQYQSALRDKVFDAVITRSFNEVFYEVSRQAGKTTGIVETVVFLITFMDLYLGRPFNVGFFAPRYEQAKTDWDKVRDVMPSVVEAFDLQAKEDNAHTMSYKRGIVDATGRVTHYEQACTMFAFSLGETTKLESKTLDLAIIEEAHEVNDRKVNKEVRPMLAATNGIIVNIGVAGYRLCGFKKGVEESKHSLIFPIDKVIKQRRIAFENTNNSSHLEYEKFYASERRRIGNVDTDEIKTQYLLEWITERGTFITRQQLDVCKRKFLCVGEPEITIGIDWGKYIDPTIVTASTSKGQRLTSLELSGTDYMAQVPMIIDWIQTLVDMGYEVSGIVCDSTGGGDVVVELLDSKSRWNVESYVFSAQSKATLYQTLMNLISVTQGIESGSIEDEGQRRFEYWTGDENAEKFEYEILNLVKEYVGDKQLLSCHHPDENDAHDDTVDSLALSVVTEPQTIGIAFF